MSVEPVRDTTKYTNDTEVNPQHYRNFSNGAQVIDIVEHLGFNRGNAAKYLARSGRKPMVDTITDLEKALWYTRRAMNYPPALGHIKISEYTNGKTPWDICEKLNFNRGSAINALCRGSLMEAEEYIAREINRIISDGKETK